MKLPLVIIILFPACIFAQAGNLSNDNISIVSPPRIFNGVIVIDSFKAVGSVKRIPKLSADLDSLSRRITYPAMEGDNGIGGNTHGYIRISNKGLIDSVWLDHKISVHIDKEIISFLKQLPLQKTQCKKYTGVYRLSFYFRVEPER